MVRQWFSVTAALAVGALFVAADSSQAQERRFNLGRRLFGNRDANSGSRAPSYVMDAYGNPMYNNAPAGRFRGPDGMNMQPDGSRPMPGEPMQPGRMGQRSFYYQPEATGAVLLQVRVPADAEILIDGAKTTQRGTLRQYISPPLEPGKNFTYEITAKYTEDGKEVSRTHRQVVRAGGRYPVDFSQLPQEHKDHKEPVKVND
jgi:uncharacterized protein (TIGR03000 family)